MKQLISKLLLLAFVLPTFVQAQTPNIDADARRQRVEQGLLPAVLIKGDPSWSIAERMKFYNAPGLSVAVIKDFKIDWAGAYGVKDVETKEPVTMETLFQAARSASQLTRWWR